jgi:hypothetical protein
MSWSDDSITTTEAAQVCAFKLSQSHCNKVTSHMCGPHSMGYFRPC